MLTEDLQRQRQRRQRRLHIYTQTQSRHVILTRTTLDNINRTNLATQKIVLQCCDTVQNKKTINIEGRVIKQRPEYFSAAVFG